MFIVLRTFGVGFVNDLRVDANGIDLPIAVTELLNTERRNSAVDCRPRSIRKELLLAACSDTR